MPKISVFFGIIISMFYNEHFPPHFHAAYGEYKASISIDSLGIIQGYLPPKALALVIESASQHKAELKKEWENAREHKPLFNIEPLE